MLSQFCSWTTREPCANKSYQCASCEELPCDSILNCFQTLRSEKIAGIFNVQFLSFLRERENQPVSADQTQGI